MWRGRTFLLLTATAGLLAGCVYDPYYRDPYGYRYAPPNPQYAGASPYGAPPAAQPGGYATQSVETGSYPSSARIEADPLPPPNSGAYPSAVAEPGVYPGSPAEPGGYPAPYARSEPYPPPAAESGAYPTRLPHPAPYPGDYQASSGGGSLAQRFAAANVTGDGRLTRQQAAAGMPRVAENFDVIDLDRRGYVTLPQIRTFIERQQAAGGQVGQFDGD